MARPNLTLRCGPGGAGKSYLFTVWSMEEFLAFETGDLITNVPLNVEVVAERVAKRHGLDAAVIADRIVLVDRETTERFKTDVEQGGLTPGMYFDSLERYRNDRGEIDYRGAVIAIDEAHWMIGPNKSENHQALWRGWVGELRHQHATLELMTQAADKLAKELVKEHELRYECVSSERKRDVFLHIPFSDWCELWARLTGKYIPRFYLQEWRNSGSGKFKQQWEASFVFSPYYGECYNSYSAAGGSTGQGVGEAPKRMHELLKGWRFWRWFIGRNWMAAGYRLFWWGVGVSIPVIAIWYTMPGERKPKPMAVVPVRPAVTATRLEDREEIRDGDIYERGTSRVRIVGFIRDGLVMADGSILMEGDKLNGKTIETIICDQCYYVVDGHEHWLQTGRLATRVAKIRDTVRTGDGRSAAGEHSGRAAPGSQPGGHRDAAVGPGPTAGGTNGPGGSNRP
jgi:hypothetical protein